MNTSIDRFLGPVGVFLRWWRAELAALVPEQLRQLSRRQRYAVLMLGEGSQPATVLIETPTGPAELARIAEPGGAAARAAVQAVMLQPEIAGPRGRDELGLCLRLPSRYAVCRSIELPLAAADNLSEVIGFELDRYTPFRAEQVYFCHRMLGRDPAGQRLAVEITVVPRSIVDGALRTAGDLGWVPERVDVAAPSPDATASDNLLPAAPTRRRGGARLTFGLAAAAVALTLAAAAIPFAGALRQAAAMTEELAVVEQQVRAVAGLKKEIDELRDGNDFLVSRKRRSPTVSDLLAETTRLLPDDTWLTELHLTATDEELSGVSASASALIGILEKSGRFRDTTFRSPVIPDQASGRERFSIAAHIVPEARR